MKRKYMEQETFKQKDHNSAKFAFFYMLSLVALVFMALGTGMIIFQVINKKLVDVINQFQGSFSSDQLKFAISALIISTPIYYLASWQIQKSLFSAILAKDSGVRKWLTYFVLFVSSVIMLGWLVAVINNFLDGELTTKFILKALTAIFIAAIIFSCYFYDIKRENIVNIKDRIILVYFYGSLALVLATLIAGFFFVESPRATRERKYDEVILNKFDLIDSNLNNYYQDNKKLPKNLDELLSNKMYYLTDNDINNPLDKKQFEYKVIEKDVYELCADFKTSNRNKEEDYYNFYGRRWLHDMGYQCLRRKVNSEVKAMPVP